MPEKRLAGGLEHRKHMDDMNQMEVKKMSVISMKQLLEAGVHFGHQTRRWNPKMAPYIYTERNGIYIIDLQKSVSKVDEAYKASKPGDIVLLAPACASRDQFSDMGERGDKFREFAKALKGELRA